MRGYAELTASGDVEPDTIFIEIGEGIGSGIFIKGKCFIGATGIAGEIGHISVNVSGPRCLCGNRGCIEKYICRDALLAYSGKVKGREMSWVEICEAYKNSNSDIVQIIREMARYLLMGIGNMVCALNIRNIILGGDAVNLGNGFIDEIIALQEETGYRKGLSKVGIRFAQLPENSEITCIARLYQDSYHRYAG